MVLAGLAIAAIPFLNESIENSQIYLFAGVGLAILGAIYSIFSKSLGQPYYGLIVNQ